VSALEDGNGGVSLSLFRSLVISLSRALSLSLMTYAGALSTAMVASCSAVSAKQQGHHVSC